ncbi:MAG: Na+/H+ antiporter subunit E [Planctomycetaceae bacterium]|nr:MAG: Na+/H+ antiporter subunit E [Planctomycetaceae bacterium]
MLFINLLLALVWTFLTGAATPNTLLEGFAVGYLVLWLASPLYGTSTYFRKFRQAVSFFVFFLQELIIATLRVAYVVVKPRISIRPGIVAVPLDVRTNAEITLLANLITLTPGTLTLDISDDRRVMYVHVMDVDDVDAFRQEIKQGFERRVGELLR